jgi:glycyl-tRNA synthetase
MSDPLYGFGGLRFWTEEEIISRERISAQILETITRELLKVNQGWVFQRVDTPTIIPRSRLNQAYTADDAFFLADPMGEEEMVLRAETTDGSYAMARHIFKTTSTKPPLGVWQLGQSFRRELSDGASASNLRFNSFYQLEFQLIFSADTHFDYGTMLREKLVELVGKITGLPTRLVDSDRLPPYATETVDIEVFWKAPSKVEGNPDYEGEWKEVCSTSRRIDFPQDHGFKKDLNVFEIAFGADRMVAVSQGHL